MSLNDIGHGISMVIGMQSAWALLHITNLCKELKEDRISLLTGQLSKSTIKTEIRAKPICQRIAESVIM